MKEIRWCRCGYSGGDHPRTPECSEGRRTISVPVDATAEQVQAAIQAALADELREGAEQFRDVKPLQ